MGTQHMFASHGPGQGLTVAEPAQQLQGLTLRAPTTQWSTCAGCFQVVGQGCGGSDGPDTRWRTWVRIDHCAVTGGKECGVSNHLQAWLGADPAAAWAAGQATVCQPMGRSTAGAKQAWDLLKLIIWVTFIRFNDLNGGFAKGSEQ